MQLLVRPINIIQMRMWKCISFQMARAHRLPAVASLHSQPRGNRQARFDTSLQLKQMEMILETLSVHLNAESTVVYFLHSYHNTKLTPCLASCCFALFLCDWPLVCGFAIPSVVLTMVGVFPSDTLDRLMTLD